MNCFERMELRRLFAIGAGPMLDPRQFGATYDGHTDDAPAIQAAINALPPTGGTVILFGVAAVGEEGIHLNGLTNVRLTAISAGDGIVLTGVPNIYREPSQFGAFGKAAIAVTNCNSCQVDDILISANDLPVTPIGMSGNVATVVTRNTIYNAGAGSALCAVSNNLDTYSWNTIVSSANGTAGMWIGNCHTGEIETNPTISGNYISGMSGTGVGTMSSGAVISGNTILHCSGSGIALSSGGQVSTSNAIVTNNVLEYNGFHGIQADCMSDAYSASGVTISGNVIYFNSNSGIYAVRAHNWVINGNYVDDNQVGIYIAASDVITASNNTCGETRLGAARTQTTGIEVLGYDAARPLSQIVLNGNQLSNNIQYGIIAATCGGVISTLTITNNTAAGNNVYNLAVLPNIVNTIIGVNVSSNSIASGILINI